MRKLGTHNSAGVEVRATLCISESAEISFHSDQRIPQMAFNPAPQRAADLAGAACVKSKMCSRKSERDCAAHHASRCGGESARILVRTATAGSGGSDTVAQIAAAFAGGTVGVMGSLIAWELRQLRDKESKQCPYCLGTGRLRCGRCLGQGELLISEVGAQAKALPKTESPQPLQQQLDGFVKCSQCEGAASVECCHCGGDGRIIPETIEHAATGDLERE